MDISSEQAGDIHQELERILFRTESLANGQAIEYRELIQMADYLAEIRMILTELKQLQTGPGAEQAGQIINFITRFIQLEGRIKEIRNDCCSSPTSRERGAAAENRERIV